MENHEFIERQNAAMTALVDAVRSCLPAGWHRAILTLNATWVPHSGMRAISHRLENPDTGESVDQFPSELFETATALHGVFCQYRQGWRHAVLKLALNAAGGLAGLEANFSYDP